MEEAPMADRDQSDPQFDAMTARLLRRQALRRAAAELNTTFGPGLEGVLASISAEVTADAASRVSATRATIHGAGPTLGSAPDTGLGEDGRGGT
jgi:phage shock protein A